MNITPEIGQRGALVGRTGSGKTTTAIEILTAALHSYPVVVIDTKGVRAFEELPGYLYESPGHLIGSFRNSDPKFAENGTGQGLFARIYRPERANNEPPALDLFLDSLYDIEQSMYIYIDEVAQVVESATKPPRGLANLLQRGRYRESYGREAAIEVSVICATQRPAWVPKIVFTESEHFYIHALSNRDDRLRMSQYTDEETYNTPPDSVNPTDPYRRYNFWYYNVVDQDLRLCRINMESEGARLAS